MKLNLDIIYVQFFYAIVMCINHIINPFSPTGAATLRSNEAIIKDRWTTIVAERNEADGSLSIDGGVAVKGKL